MNKYIPFYEDNQDITKTTNFKKWFGNSKVVDRKEPFDDNIYLNDVHEIMAFAWQLIDYYRLMKLSKEQILKVLQKPYEYLELQNNILSGFIRANRKGVVTDKSLKLLYKYAYEYAKEV